MAEVEKTLGPISFACKVFVIASQPEDVGSGAIDWVTSHDIYEQYVREHEAQEVQGGHEG
jgi:hypothetical protein